VQPLRLASAHRFRPAPPRNPLLLDQFGTETPHRAVLLGSNCHAHQIVALSRGGGLQGETLAVIASVVAENDPGVFGLFALQRSI